MRFVFHFLLLPLLLVGGAGFAQERLDSLEIPAPFVTNVAELLKGRTVGVDVISSAAAPGLEPTVYIRGVPVVAGKEPLYVVDGMRVTSLSFLSPEDIEQVRALKDGPALPLYGPDAADGVIIVTTRRGKRKGFHASYSFQGLIQRPAWAPASLTLKEKDQLQWPYSLEKATFTIANKTETSFSHSHHLNLQYGGEKLDLYTGFSYLNQDAPLKNDDRFKRYTGSWRMAWHPLTWFSMETTGHWGRGERNEDLFFSWANMIRSDQYDPLHEYGMGDGTYSNFFTGTTALNFYPVKGLSIHANAAYTRTKTDYIRPDWAMPYSEIQYYGELNTWNQWQAGANAIYEITMETGHHLRAGIDYRYRRYEETLVSAYGYAPLSSAPWGNTPEVLNMVLIPDVEVFMNTRWENLGNCQMISPSKNSYRWNELSANLGYDWNGRYSVDAALQRSVFSEGEGKEPFFAWSVVADWKLSDEPFIRSFLPSWLREWNLRGSLGQTGRNVRNSPNLIYIEEYFHPRYVDGGYFESVCSFSDCTSYRREVGMDWTLSLAGELSLSLTAFWNKDKMGRYVPPMSVNSTTPYVLYNEGWELSASWKGTYDDIRYSIGGNISFLKNKVETQDDSSVGWIWDNNRFLRLANGYPVGVHKLYPYQDSFSQEHSFYIPDETTSSYMGGPMPSVSYGLHAMVGWKAFSLTVSGHGMGGNHIVTDNTLNALTRYFLNNYPLIAIMRSNLTLTSACLFRGDFFRVDQIRVDYNLPLRRSKVQGTLFVSAENFFLFTRYPGSDPEMALLSEGFGMETAPCPTGRGLLLGVHLGF